MSNRIPDAPPVILPIANEGRPLWSVMIPAFNCIQFLSDTINSVLMQDPGQEIMQIEVVDDASTDGDIEAVVLQLGKGRISYFRQMENVGSLRNFETCINRSKGHLVHLLHGDDRVKPGFYKEMGKLFERFPQVGAAFSNWDFINADGSLIKQETARSDKPVILENCLESLAHGQLMQYVCMVVKRKVYEDLGAFYGVTYGEDWIMWARIAQKYSVAYTPESLAEYRTHYSSISGNSFLSGKNISDIKKVFAEISALLPHSKGKKARISAKRNYSLWAIDSAKFMYLRTGQRKVVYSQVYQLFWLYPNRVLIYKSFLLMVFVWNRELKITLKKLFKKNPR